MKHVFIGILAVLVFFTGLGIGSAAVEFEDLALGTIYRDGDSFTSSGVAITVTRFQSRDGMWSGSWGSTRVSNNGYARGAGQELWVSNVNVGFNFGHISGLSLLYSDYGGNLNISINGDFRNFEDMPNINGTTIGGVQVFVTANSYPGNYYGTLALQGIIDSFAIGGQEFAIDSVTPVPEPGSAVALAGSLLGLAVTALRRLNRL